MKIDRQLFETAIRKTVLNGYIHPIFGGRQPLSGNIGIMINPTLLLAHIEFLKEKRTSESYSIKDGYTIVATDENDNKLFNIYDIEVNINQLVPDDLCKNLGGIYILNEGTMTVANLIHYEQYTILARKYDN